MMLEYKQIVQVAAFALVAIVALYLLYLISQFILSHIFAVTLILLAVGGVALYVYYSESGNKGAS